MKESPMRGNDQNYDGDDRASRGYRNDYVDRNEKKYSSYQNLKYSIFYKIVTLASSQI